MKLFGILDVVKKDLPKILPLLRDPAVPTWSKALTAGALLFIISPLNILGDIPLLGFADDGALAVFVLHLFVSFAQKRAGTSPT